MMEGDLFSAGFVWADDPVATDATDDATPAAASASAFYGEALADPWPAASAATPVATGNTGYSRSEKVSGGYLNGAAVSSVATVAETEGQRLERLLSPQLVAARATADATPCETAETANFCGVPRNSGGRVAPVASVADWRDGVERMRRARPAPRPYHTAWRTLFQDAVSFLNLWGDDAARMGWDTLDVFGGNPDPSHGRYDRLGLVILLAGRPIQCLDEDCAYIGQDNKPTVYRRALRAPGGVPVWQWIEEGSQ